MTVKNPKTRNYLYSAEAINALNALADNLKEKGQKKSKAQIVSDAIVHYALSQGIKIEGQKGEESIQSLAKKTQKLERLVEALCRIDFDYECSQEKELVQIRQSITRALGNGCPRNAEALWERVQEDLPKCVQDEDRFMLYVGGYGIPVRPKKKKKTK